MGLPSWLHPVLAFFTVSVVVGAFMTFRAEGSVFWLGLILAGAASFAGAFQTTFLRVPAFAAGFMIFSAFAAMAFLLELARRSGRL